MIGAVFESDLARLVRARLVAPAGSAAAVRVPDVLVLSVAGTTRNDVPPLALTALYEDVIQHLKGLLIVAPAGNEGDDRRNWPASFSWVVSVGALTADGAHRAAWSNHGRTVDVYAPGEDLVNAYASGRYTYAWDGPQRGETVTFTARSGAGPRSPRRWWRGSWRSACPRPGRTARARGCPSSRRPRGM